MPLLNDLVRENLQQFGLEPFGIGLPRLSKKWINSTTADLTGNLTYNASALSLSSTENWLLPITAHGIKVDADNSKIDTTLTRADGTAVTESGLFFDIFPQAYRRLQKLYTLKFETAGTHNPQRANGISIRPVPKYIFIVNDSISEAVKGGFLKAGESTDITGELMFFDEQGYIISPLAVAAAFNALSTLYTGLVAQDTPDHITGILDLEADSFHVRYVNPDGTPYDGSFIDNDTEVSTDIGLFTANDFTGADTTLKAQLIRQADTGESGDFPAVQARHLHFGLSTYGRWGATVNIPKINPAVTLKHEFYTIKVLDTRTYLAGTPDPDYNGTKIEPKPTIRLHENLQLLPDGNSIMRQLQLIFNGSSTESLLVGTELDNIFPLPDTDEIYWPGFPPATSAISADDADFPLNLKVQLNQFSTAELITATADIKLTLTGLPLDAAVRIYTRFFTEDARLLRKPGPGAVVETQVAVVPDRTFNGQVIVNLKNPLNLEAPFTFAPNPLLVIDLCIVQRSGKKRIYGTLEIPINTAPVSAEPSLLPNAADGASRKGVSNAAILGLHTASVNFIPTADFNDFLNKIIQLSGETQPRDASRLPTMARRDLLAATLRTGSWSALIAGGGIGPFIHSAIPNLGAPGTRGGKESQVTGIMTQNACLAYDIGRMAFRRTTSIYNRIQDLNNDNWNEPAVNEPLAIDAPTTSATGTICGALLQNISPYCETPELTLIKSLVDSQTDGIPPDWNALVDRVVDKINGINLGGLPGLLNTAATRLQTEMVTKLNALKDNDPLRENTRERLYSELLREISTSCFGRRDSQWALELAINNARRFIYIETPGFSETEIGDSHNYTRNLRTILNNRITACPGLKVIICVPRAPDYGKGYELFAAKEVQERFNMVIALPTKNLVAFHPIGFPGVDSNIECQSIIVDDEWAMVGSSAFRRRGLTFDGSSDLVFTELDRLNGISPKIHSYRKSLMATRLGIPVTEPPVARAIMIEDASKAFYHIREMLIDGGLGKIDRLWNGHTEGVPFIEPNINRDLVNPEGIEFNSLNASFFALLSSLEV